MSTRNKGKTKTPPRPKKLVRDIEAGDVVLISGVWREVTNTEHHERDAYRILFTSAFEGGPGDERRWVRSIFDELGVKTDAS